MISAASREELQTALGDAVHFDVPMSRHTSLRVGGPADALATPSSRDQLSRLLEICARESLPMMMLGAGFNILVREGGLDGMVICLKKFRSLTLETDGTLHAESGVSHSQITRFCVDRALTGLEFGAGIPGTVGGWVAMNAGIPTRELVDVVMGIELMGPGPQPSREVDRGQLQFRYRALESLPDGAVIVSARLAVQPSDKAEVQAEVKRMLASRALSQPLDVPSCGSVFKNPTGDFAGRLIEQAGLKGEKVGGAQISPLHANFIANLGGATSDDVAALIRKAREAVKQASGIDLETEVRIVGRPA